MKLRDLLDGFTVIVLATCFALLLATFEAVADARKASNEVREELNRMSVNMDARHYATIEAARRLERAVWEVVK